MATVVIHDFLILIGKARDGVKLKIKHFRKLRLLYHLSLTVEGKHSFRVTSDFARYQGFNISKIHFRITLNFIQVRLMLTWNCTIRKQTHCRQVISWIWKSDQNKELQYQEQDFDSIQGWLSLKPWSSSLSCCLNPAIWLASLPGQTVPFFQQALSVCLCRPHLRSGLHSTVLKSPRAHGFHSRPVHWNPLLGLLRVAWWCDKLRILVSNTVLTWARWHVSLFHYQCHRCDKP